VNGGVFPDERFNTLGGLLGVVGGEPLPHRGDYAFYGVIDQIVWRRRPSRARFLPARLGRPERSQPDRPLFRPRQRATSGRHHKALLRFREEQRREVEKHFRQ
jgi:hypothetical protein